MPRELMNLTLAGVNQTIEDVLDDYPVHPYQYAFSMPELRQKLIDHIFSQVMSRYAIEGVQDVASAMPMTHFARLQVRLWTEMLVRGSILHILRENAVWLSRHFSNV